MRTTLELDDDLVRVAKAIAQKEGRTLGHVISRLAQQSLNQSSGQPKVRNGVPLFTPKPSSQRPDLALVNALRDE